MGIRRLTERALVALLNRRKKPARPKPLVGEALGWDVADPSTPFCPSQEMRLRHTYILGATGSGKTNYLFQQILRDIQGETSVAVLDMRGDLIDRLLREGGVAALAFDRIHIIDLRNPQISSGVNPFQSTSDPYSAALQALAIFRASADSWGVQIDETMRCSLIVLSLTRRSVGDLPKFLVDEAFRAALLREIDDDQALAFFERFETLGPDRQLQWVLPVMNKVSPFLSHPTIRAVLSEKRPLDLSSVLDTKGSILLVGLAIDRLHALAGMFGSLMVSAIENAVMQRVDTAEVTRNPVYLYLDEFENFQSPAFESIIAEGRRFKLGLTLSHQNLSQLDLRLRQTITNNAATRVYFRTGQADAAILATELESFGVANAKASLMRLPVGEAFVITEASEARHIRFRESKRTMPAPAAVSALFEALKGRTEPLSQPGIASKANVPHCKHVRKPRAASSPGGQDEA